MDTVHQQLWFPVYSGATRSRQSSQSRDTESLQQPHHRAAHIPVANAKAENPERWVSTSHGTCCRVVNSAIFMKMIFNIPIEWTDWTYSLVGSAPFRSSRCWTWLTTISAKRIYLGTSSWWVSVAGLIIASRCSLPQLAYLFFFCRDPESTLSSWQRFRVPAAWNRPTEKSPDCMILETFAILFEFLEKWLVPGESNNRALF